MRMGLAEFRQAVHTMAGVAVHESAHCCVSALYGGKPRAVIKLHSPVREWLHDNNTLGLSFHPGLPAERMPAVNYAGPWAEARWRAGKRPTQAQMYAAFDGHGCRDAAALSASADPWPTHVQPVLERCWASVLKLADKLVEAGEVNYDAVCKALGIPVADNGYERALILSGSVPGSFSVTRAG
jgi:hypothetical protein